MNTLNLQLAKQQQQQSSSSSSLLLQKTQTNPQSDRKKLIPNKQNNELLVKLASPPPSFLQKSTTQDNVSPSAFRPIQEQQPTDHKRGLVRPKALALLQDNNKTHSSSTNKPEQPANDTTKLDPSVGDGNDNSDGQGLVLKLMELKDDTSRTVELRNTIAPVVENNFKATVPPSVLLKCIANQADTYKFSNQKQQLDRLKQIAIIARLVIMKLYGTDSSELKQFEDGLRPAFAPLTQQQQQQQRQQQQQQQQQHHQNSPPLAPVAAAVTAKPTFLQQLQSPNSNSLAAAPVVAAAATKPTFLQQLQSANSNVLKSSTESRPANRPPPIAPKEEPQTLVEELQAKLAQRNKAARSKRVGNELSPNESMQKPRQIDSVPALVSTIDESDDQQQPTESEALASQNLDELESQQGRSSNDITSTPDWRLALATAQAASKRQQEEQEEQQEPEPALMVDESWKEALYNSESSEEEGGVLVTSLNAPPAGWTVSEKSSSDDDDDDEDNSGVEGDNKIASRIAPSPPPEEPQSSLYKDETDPTSGLKPSWGYAAMAASFCVLGLAIILTILFLTNTIGNNEDSPLPTGFPTMSPSTADTPTGNVPTIPTLSPERTMQPSFADSLPSMVSESPTFNDLTRTENPTFNELQTIVPTASPNTVSPVSSTVSPTISPTSRPTTGPSTRPTSVPTQPDGTDTPTSQSAGGIVELPEYTQPLLEDPSSPQSLAKKWLENDPGLATYENWRQLQRFALATFYYSFNGPEWPAIIQETWMSYEGSECDWFSNANTIVITLENGMTQLTTQNDQDSSVCNVEGRYINFEVYDGEAAGTPFHENFVTSFVGTMPPEVALLTSLENLGVHTNASVLGVSMEDLLPAQFQDLTKLTSLDLSDNLLTDWDVEAILNIPSVTVLDVSDNNFEGTFPSNLGLLTGLSQLDVSNSYKSSNQNIPSEFGLLTALRRLALSSNRLSGAFPNEFQMLLNLRVLDVSKNNIESFPPTTLTNLEVLDLSSGRLDSTVPEYISFFTALRILNVSKSGLVGTVPADFGFLTNLESVNLSQNELTGTIPSLLGLATSLEVINLESNMLGGSLPSELLSMPGLQELYVGSNSLIGTIDSAIGDLTSLRVLMLRNNVLTGSLPSQVGLLRELLVLDVKSNTLAGNLPWSEISSLATNLTFLSVASNDFSGTIGTEIGLMTALSQLDLSRNTISGGIPSEIGKLRQDLKELVLDWNLLSNPLPSELGLLTSLKVLSARGYTIRGTIPREIGDMQQLEELWLSGNPITGSIPTRVGLLSSLELMSLDLTTISGRIPSEIGTLSTLSFLYLNATDLTGSVPEEICSLELQVLAVDCGSVECDCGCDC